MTTPRKPRKPKTFRRWTLVEVEWNDIYSKYGDYASSEFETYVECIRKSLGYVQIDAPDRLVIVHTDDRGALMESNVGDALVIPRGVVKNIVKLAPAK